MTERILHELVQGSPEWHAFRLEHDGASEAAAMLGLSPYMSRSELLRQKATGIAPEVDEGTQARFNAGHEAEAAARMNAEAVIGEALYPATYSFGRMSASCDGITMDETTAFEHKLMNADLYAAVAKSELPDAYQPQCQQVMMVTGAERVLFMVSDGTLANCAHMWVEPDTAWQKRIADGWRQFNADLADYKPVEVIPAAVAAPTLALPALSIKVEGAIKLIDNLAIFGAGLKAFIAKIPEKPSTDQEFADCKEACKTLQDAQDRLDAAESSALAQVATFDEMRRTKALYHDLARTTRLAVEKLVAAREQAIKVEIVQKGRADFAAHIAGLNTRLGKPYMPSVPENFAGVIKGKRTISSLQNAVDTELARVKIESNAIADRIGVNLNTLRDLAKDHAFLFADAAQIVMKESDDLTALVKMRIMDHAAAEAKRLEAEREKIRAEEAAKLKAEQDAKYEEEQRLHAAEVAKIEADAKAKEQARAQEKAITGADVSAGQSVTAPAAARNSEGVAQSRPELAGTTGGVSSPGPTKRPSDDAIIDAICLAFRVHESKAIEWLLDMDLDGAAERMVSQMNSRAA